MLDDGYPKIDFKIDGQDIQALIDQEILDHDLNFTNNVTSKITDPLAKLLYATAWKNGDLKKVRRIINGIEDADSEFLPNEALVFHQFGKFLKKTHGEPIIDQHVIRAFAVFYETTDSEINKYRKLDILTKKHKPIILAYKKWLISNNLKQELRNIDDYSYYIDKLLFAAGKTIKTKKII